MGINHCQWVEIWQDGWCSKTQDIVSYALKVSVIVNGVTCVCSPFQVIRHILKFVNWLHSYHPRVHQNMWLAIIWFCIKPWFWVLSIPFPKNQISLSLHVHLCTYSMGFVYLIQYSSTVLTTTYYIIQTCLIVSSFYIKLLVVSILR